MNEHKSGIPEIEKAYSESIAFTKSHYENFPVISFLIKKDLRKDVAVVYQFARTADDIADEGNLPESERIAGLNDFESNLSKALTGDYCGPFWMALHHTIRNRNLNASNFYNLLKAFKQDVVKKRYVSSEELLEYCQNSANPVGRIILELHGIRHKEAMEYSDNICTALQLANFYQDISLDYEKGRIYIPKNELDKFGVSEEHFKQKSADEKFKSMLKSQTEAVRNMFLRGRNLLQFLPYKLRMEISWTIFGGEAILDEIKKIDYDTLNFRPKLSKTDFVILLIKSLAV